MILYVIHGNTYYDGYGYIENIFGIYTEKDAAEAAKDLIIKELYEKRNCKRSDVCCRRYIRHRSENLRNRSRQTYRYRTGRVL